MARNSRPKIAEFVAVVGLVVLSLAPRALSAEQTPGACDLDPWVSVSAAPGEEGYHVLCVVSPGAAEVYRNAVMTDTPEVLSFSASSLRSGLSELLEIKTTIVYDTPEKGRLEWKKQPWALFTAAGAELQAGAEVASIEGLLDWRSEPVVLLLFEGGVWRWPTISVGYKREVTSGISLTTVSRQPALFEVKIEEDRTLGDSDDQLSIKLLSNVVKLAEKQLAPSAMEGKVDKAVRSSDQTFMRYDSDPQLKKLSRGTAKLLRGYEDQLEHLQVLRYAKNQHYDAHRDYWDPREFPSVPRFRSAEGYWHQRHVTLLWYLAAPEKGGETWFPRAHGGPIPWGSWTACDKRGAKISPANATAVLFYSLRADGEIDEFSWHCGCKVLSGVKWAANSWMSNSPKRHRPKHRREL